MTSEEEQFQKRSVLYFRIGLVFLYVFAFLHSLGPFFSWMSMGGVFYGFILSLYYRRLSHPHSEPDPDQEHWSTADGQPVAARTSTQLPSLTNILRFAPIILGSVMIIAIMAIVFSSGNDEESSKEQVNVQDVDYTAKEKAKDIPTDAEALVDRGNEFYNASEHDSAQFYYKKALRVNPDYKEAQYNIALDFYSQTKYSEAIVAIDQCLQQHPAYGEAWQLKGDCMYYLEKEDEALSLYEKSYAIGTRNAFLSHMLGYLYDVKENTSKAITFYKEAIQMDSSKVEVYKRLAQLEPERAEWYTKKAEDWADKN